ncbi:MAG: hypothetical protein J2P15_05060 [Micromonosporaceae bacterium]|nr:hypothetical protein [Micromonosporaceae bacterium]
MHDVAVNLLASLVAASAAWLAQWLLRYRRQARRRAFFGVTRGEECMFVVARRAGEQSEHSVSRRDGAALVELAAVVRACGGQADLVPTVDTVERVGRRTEFCVGGPSANPRMAAHLRAMLPGVQIAPVQGARVQSHSGQMTVGGTSYQRVPGRLEYVLLAKAYPPDRRHPVFLLCGQTAQSNLAAARLLATRHRRLIRTHGTSSPFCLVLRIVEPATYGPDFVQLAADVTGEAFRAADAIAGPAAEQMPSQPAAG